MRGLIVQWLVSEAAGVGAVEAFEGGGQYESVGVSNFASDYGQWIIGLLEEPPRLMHADGDDHLLRR